MESIMPGMEAKVDDLLRVLDEDIRHVRASLERLDELRGLVIKRDQAGLGRLLEKIREETQEYSTNESKRELIRMGFAADLRCPVGDMTLSRLESLLGDQRRIEVGERQALLWSLMQELKKEHARTAMLLSDCARFNSVLLRSIVDPGNAGGGTYGSDGVKQVQTNSVFVSLQL
ncbi:MAG: hypothetical protein JXN61_11150 [Sedimentisphaerales bacterium]|nr:hypothetical protein [Sedimentisphaerales bacterium]